MHKYPTPVIPTSVYPYMPIPSQQWLTRRSDVTASLSHTGPRCFTFWSWGLTPGPKLITTIGDDLLPQVYHPVTFHLPASTHAGDIRYKSLRTNKERNSKRCIPACLSACGDKKRLSMRSRSPYDSWETIHRFRLWS